MRYSFYRSADDVIVHLPWNALHKCGGKQSGAIDWSIILKPCPLSTQEARPRLQGICNVVSYLMTLVLETVLNVTSRHCPWSLINPMRSLYEEVPSEEVSEPKTPWQQRRPCKCMTLSPGVLKASVLYCKTSKTIYNMHSTKSLPWNRI